MQDALKGIERYDTVSSMAAAAIVIRDNRSRPGRTLGYRTRRGSHRQVTSICVHFMSMTFSKPAGRSGISFVYNSRQNEMLMRPPPCRSRLQVYRSLVLKVLNLRGQQDTRGAPIVTATGPYCQRRRSPAQTAARCSPRLPDLIPEQNVGTKIVVTQQENTPDKNQNETTTAAPSRGQESSSSPKASVGSGDKKW
ncbi:hypothetical protein V5799_013851 [Amblyomma americanum]|uniref:Uncharacterized protein n=1 Tax=Amblyomma americanum TaxID=6943 RepID=A0AAQ4E4P8_AMBAM